MTVRKTAAKPATATGDVTDATAAADAKVLDGVTAETGTAPARRARTTNRAPKPGVTKTVPAKANGAAKPAPAKAKTEPGYRAYATKEVPAAMTGFSKWISREFADLFPEGVDPRLVTIASKTYRHFQSSDLNK